METFKVPIYTSDASVDGMDIAEAILVALHPDIYITTDVTIKPEEALEILKDICLQQGFTASLVDEVFSRAAKKGGQG